MSFKAETTWEISLFIIAGFCTFYLFKNVLIPWFTNKTNFRLNMHDKDIQELIQTMNKLIKKFDDNHLDNIERFSVITQNQLVHEEKIKTIEREIKEIKKTD